MELMKFPEHCVADFLSLGALNHRVDPGIVPFSKATHWDVYPSGGEYNVAANLSDCFRLSTGIISAMVDYPIGDLIDRQVRAMGLVGHYKHFAHNGVTGPNMATIYSDRGFGNRAPEVFYNRSDEAAARLKPGDFNWDEVFSGGVKWLHSGGIFASLSETTGELIIDAMQAAKARGMVTSFDLNYRAKLWNLWGGEQTAQKVLSKIVDQVDVLVGNEEDLQLGLGIKGPQITAKSKLDPSVFIEMLDAVSARYPNLKVVATTLRDVHSTNHHSWSAVAWINNQVFHAPTCELTIYDRVGGGDGFAAGLFFGLIAGVEPQQAINLGWAHGALLTTFPGDTTMATLDQVKAFARGGSARIQR